MAELTLQALTAPLAGPEPCGPDLDAADDDDYMNVLVTAETVLPPDYMVPDHEGVRQPFDQNRHYKDLDLGAQVAAARPLTERTRDLRVMMLLAKLCVLRKSLGEFGVCVTAVAVLLETRWDTVHPRPEDGGLAIRRETLQRLDDPLIIAGLTHVPLFVNKRLGAVTLHRYMAEVATAEAAPEGAGDPASLDKMLAEEANLDLAVLVRTRDGFVPTRDALTEIKQALVRIRAVCVERMSYDAPRIDALPQLIDRLLSVVLRIFGIAEAAVRRQDPNAATEDPEAALEPDSAAAEAEAEAGATVTTGQAVRPGALGNVEAASRALAGAADYFRRMEPSNPALLLLGHAQALVGKSFIEALRMMAPDSVDKAVVRIGTAATFDLPLLRLAEAGPAEAPVGMSDATDEESQPQVENRAGAVALLEAVSAYYRAYEPSSPIPLLADRARTLIGRDFLSLMGDLSPKK